jgi:hypothetical protein
MTLKLETSIWWKNEATDLRVLAQARLHVTPSTDCEGMKSIDRLIQTSHDRNVASHFSVFWVLSTIPRAYPFSGGRRML